LTAINQYFIHAEICENWRVMKLIRLSGNNRNGLTLESGAVEMYNRFVRLAREEGGNASRELFERLLRDEERHLNRLEAQISQISEMGYERYLSQQIPG
jgi:bacterioferritin